MTNSTEEQTCKRLAAELPLYTAMGKDGVAVYIAMVRADVRAEYERRPSEDEPTERAECLRYATEFLNAPDDGEVSEAQLLADWVESRRAIARAEGFRIGIDVGKVERKITCDELDRVRNLLADVVQLVRELLADGRMGIPYIQLALQPLRKWFRLHTVDGLLQFVNEIDDDDDDDNVPPPPAEPEGMVMEMVNPDYADAVERNTGARPVAGVTRVVITDRIEADARCSECNHPYASHSSTACYRRQECECAGFKP